MIIYSVEVNITETIHDEWLQWMLSEHIPEVMSTDCFTSYSLYRLIQPEPEYGITYVIQYECENMDEYENYKLQYAPTLQAKHADKFGSNFTARRLLMEKIRL